MPVSKNTWNKGLNSDLSKLKSQQDSYLDAKNIRVITDDGNSTLAIENVKGNTFNFQIPKVEATWEFDFTGVVANMGIILGRNIGGILIAITLTIDPTSKSNEFITNDLNQQLANFAISNPGLGWEYCKFYFNSGYLVLYDFLPQSSLLPSLSVNTTNGIHVKRTEKVPNHTILGQGYYNDNLVLITCDANSNDDHPEDYNTEGFLWDIEYDNATNTVVSTSLDGVYLLPQPTLKYAGKLNLSREYAINKHLKCRFENVEIARVVWTDWHNDLRICNILDEQIYATPEALFSYTPQHFPQKPVVKALIGGGTLPSGKYQYWYQLSSNQGATSTFSPVSNLINLFPGSVNGPSAFTTVGVAPGVSSAKSVEVNVINLDTNYDTIRFGYTVYQIPDFPESFFFDERPVPDTGILTVVHNGNENDIPVSSTNINNLNRSPQVFKTIDVVKNRLFAANAITTYFDLTKDEFDARAYRFTSSTAISEPRTAKLYNVGDIYPNASVIIDGVADSISVEGALPISPINYNIIPEDFDLINPFNNENPNPALNPFTNGGINGWATDSQYKYQINGTTIGGTGPNISYEFVTHDQLPANNTFPVDLVYINPGIDYNALYASEQNDTYTYPAGNGLYLNSMKSPLQETLFTGYSRGEVYRWGIVFYDLNGNPSYTLWIGDIKFPFASDQRATPVAGDDGTFGLTDLNTTYNANSHNVQTRQIGIKFTLNTSSPQFTSIRNKISGWSYVRVKRDVNNSTRLGTGYIQFVAVDTLYQFAGLCPFSGIGVGFWGAIGPGGNGLSNTATCIQTLNTPNFFNRTVGNFQTGDYIKFIGKTYNYPVSPDLTQYKANIVTPAQLNWNGYYIAANNIDYKFSDANLSIPTDIAADVKFPILANLNIGIALNGSFTPNTVIPAQWGGFPLDFYNMANYDNTNFDAKLFGEWGVENNLICFDNLNSNYNNIPHPQTDVGLAPIYVNYQLGLYYVSYERYLTGQYGGDDRSSRYGNEYIFANHFMPYSSTMTGPWSNEVYGGDTWVTVFDYQRSNLNYATDGSGFADDGTGSAFNLSLAVFYPAESNFNPELNTIAQHASVRSSAATGTNSITRSNYVYNPAFSQENSGVVFVSKAYLQSNIVREPHTIYPSEPKLDGELTDSWRSLLVNNALSVNGNYGEINRVIEFKDKLFFYQNDGVGIASVDERVLANEADITQTQLGTGTVLQRFDYVSTQTGSKHSFAVEATGDGIYHYDAFINKMFKFQTTKDGSGINSLTDVKGLSGFFRTAFNDANVINLKSTDKLLRTGNRIGISSGFNSEYNSVYFTFFIQSPKNESDIKFTISYNELLDKFESFYDFFPSLYLNMRKRFISVNPNDNIHRQVYTHNNNSNRTTFYGDYFPAYIKFRVNENSDFVKTFDNFQLNTEVTNLANTQLPLSVTRLAINNDYQTVPETTATLIQKIRSWRMALPRDETNPALTIKPRIADKYIDVKFIFDNSPTYKFLLHDVLTEYSMRSKIIPR
jgi:hypothetical protein